MNIKNTIDRIKEDQGAPAFDVIGQGWYKVAIVDTTTERGYQHRGGPVVKDTLTDIFEHAKAKAQELANKYGIRGPLELKKLEEEEEQFLA